MQRVLLLLLIPFIIASCKNSGKQDNKDNDQTHVPEKIWYKRYTGTIAGQQVVVNLSYEDSNKIRGVYYYIKKEIPLELDNDPDSTKGDSYYIYETERTERTDENDYHNNNHWKVTINGDKLSGKWISLDKNKTYDIDLKEDYSDGAYRFDLLSHLASLSVKKNKDIGAVSTYLLSMPAAGNNQDENRFLESIVLHEVGGDSTRATDINEVMHSLDTAFFNNYCEEIDTSADVNENETLAYSYEAEQNISVIYNQQGLVVFESLGYNYTGGAHGLYASTFVCADVLEKKVWTLSGIMTVDTPKLMAIIEKEARRQFKIPDTAGLKETLLVDTIPVTDNVYFTSAGIMFLYNPYEIACYADGQVNIFIPFTSVMDMLTPEFRKRMKL